MVEAVYRWLAFHSSLDAEMDDAIIVGASSLSQLKQNIVAVENGALSDDIVESFSTAWEISKADSPECFTFYKG
jgi:aflatoxin B1 aldehyde reductase